ncbi:hypothetical protein [Streptacidiphilus jiangxiensis]|uniref:Uncharacterized protein n=1 Tax=Streptacidiphilus jiangxiensis TaxID=235985 RepID=A0A1H7KHP4_STRJI|nr:hypothetical protein [Streptacidiphilus jiangxiensis]SEK85447.1 hypothetical protein SAMN05414137_10417 [Streptacidiphilus jiangxiensis]
MLSIPRRRPLVWALCAVLSAAAWALLLTGALTGRETAGVGLLFAGGWNVSLLPVHARPWAARRDRHAAPTEQVPPQEPQNAEA